jgi:dTDP-4-amino-4,6-dideoxygalactose transaminase
LALFGGTPAFATPLHVGTPNIGDTDRLFARIRGALERRRLTNDGPLVQEFESSLAALLGVRHCVAFCNGTIALQAAIKACGLTGEVIVPSFTFIATPHALSWLGLTPVFCDIDPATHNIDPAAVEALVTEATTGIIGVHIWGRACPVEDLANLAERKRLRLLFDAAHGLACSHRGTMIGHFGDAEVFSFHATKIVNAFEGGVVATNRDDLAAAVRLMRNFGFEDYDRVVSIGTNGKLTEVAAAMGVTSLECLDEFRAVNHRNYHRYLTNLRDLAGVSVIRYDERESCNFHYVVLELDEAIIGLSRNDVQRVLWAENIWARRYFYPGCHHMEPYRSMGQRQVLPHTEALCARVLCLPNGTAISEDAVDTICHVLRSVVAARSELHELLSKAPLE